MVAISVSRDGLVLGSYYLDGVKEGLSSGYFTEQDWGWYEGQPQWLPLIEVVARVEHPTDAMPVSKTKTTPMKTPSTFPLAGGNSLAIDKTVKMTNLPFLKKPPQH